MTFDFEGPGNPSKRSNLFHLSHVLTNICIIKVCFPANTDISGYGNEQISARMYLVNMHRPLKECPPFNKVEEPFYKGGWTLDGMQVYQIRFSFQ